MKSKFRYIVNSDRIFVVKDQAFKLCDSDIISTDVKNINKLLQIEKSSEIGSNSLFSINSILNNYSQHKSISYEYKKESKESSNGEYKIKLEIQTENFWASFPTRTERELEFWITNYKKNFVGLFYVKKRNTTYEINLDTYDEEALDVSLSLTSSATNHDIGSYNKSVKALVLDGGWSNRYNPKLIVIKAVASSGPSVSIY